MLELLLWAGRIVLLLLALAYLWAISGRAGGGELRNRGSGRRGGEGLASELAARIRLVQDNAVEGVTLAGDGQRVMVHQEVPLEEEVTLGRDPENSLVVGDRFTSGRHARLFRRDGGYWVEDLGSTNGTLLNGHRVSGARRLSAGDRITVGSCTFKFMG